MVLLIFLETLKTDNQAELTKINILSQIIYVAVTTVLVYLTQRTFRLTQLEKHHAVLPHIVLSEYGFWDSNTPGCTEDLMFSMKNIGKGHAFNILVEVRQENEKDCFHTTSCARLAPIESAAVDILSHIRDEINQMRRNGENGTSYSPFINDKVEIDIPLQGRSEEYDDLLIEVRYRDLYGKKYISKINVKTIDAENDKYDLVESFIEE